MKILFDHQAFTGKQYGGVPRYFCDLMAALQKEQQKVILSTVFSNNNFLQKSKEFAVHSYDNYFGTRFTSLLFSHINRANSARRLTFKNYDIFHPTYFNPYFLPFMGKKKYVITFHDAIPEKFSHKYAELDGFSFETKREVLDKAARIIAISENTKNDIIEIFGIDGSKISVVHHGSKFVDTPPKDTNRPDFVTKDYVLFVGSRHFYKNFNRFIEAIADLLHTNDIQLICAGGGEFDADEVALIKRLRLENKVIQRSVTDEQLYSLYKHAQLFVYSSLYEGFGLPIIEAFACGCPVVLSEASCFPEIAQDAGYYFNPTDLHDMATRVAEMLFDSELRQTYIERGNQRGKLFTTQNMALNTLNVYQQALGF